MKWITSIVASSKRLYENIFEHEQAKKAQKSQKVSMMFDMFEFNFFLVFANIPLSSKSLVNFPSGA